MHKLETNHHPLFIRNGALSGRCRIRRPFRFADVAVRISCALPMQFVYFRRVQAAADAIRRRVMLPAM